MICLICQGCAFIPPAPSLHNSHPGSQQALLPPPITTVGMLNGPHVRNDASSARVWKGRATKHTRTLVLGMYVGSLPNLQEKWMPELSHLKIGNPRNQRFVGSWLDHHLASKLVHIEQAYPWSVWCCVICLWFVWPCGLHDLHMCILYDLRNVRVSQVAGWYCILCGTCLLYTSDAADE